MQGFFLSNFNLKKSNSKFDFLGEFFSNFSYHKIGRKKKPPLIIIQKMYVDKYMYFNSY